MIVDRLLAGKRLPRAHATPRRRPIAPPALFPIVESEVSGTVMRASAAGGLVQTAKGVRLSFGPCDQPLRPGDTVVFDIRRAPDGSLTGAVELRKVCPWPNRAVARVLGTYARATLVAVLEEEDCDGE